MSQAVVIKSNKYGIQLILDGEIPFEELIESVKTKFIESAKFFKNAALAISFEGRSLSALEQKAVIDVITSNTDINILCIVDEDRARQELYKKSIEAANSSPEVSSGRDVSSDIVEKSVKQSSFYEGTLRSGQILECDTGVVILGDVNPGARIISQGNIVILGALKGTAFAGSAGDRGCFIAALEMDPIQIQIGDILAKSPDKDKKEKAKRPGRKHQEAADRPMMAISKNGNIYIEPIRKNG